MDDDEDPVTTTEQNAGTDVSNSRIRIYARVRPVKNLTQAIGLDRETGKIEIRVPKNVLSG